MPIIPTMWSFQENEFIPILDVKGENPEKESERGMFYEAVIIIKKAGEFNGIPLQKEPEPANHIARTVSFSIIFRNNEELKSFMKAIILE